MNKTAIGLASENTDNQKRNTFNSVFRVGKRNGKKTRLETFCIYATVFTMAAAHVLSIYKVEKFDYRSG